MSLKKQKNNQTTPVEREPSFNAAKGKRLYSIKELASEIGGTEWFWRSQIWDGNIPFVQVGRKIFIDREDIETFIQRHKKSNQIG